MADKTIPSFDDFVKNEYKPGSPQPAGSPPSFDEFVKNEYQPQSSTYDSLRDDPLSPRNISDTKQQVGDWMNGPSPSPISMAGSMLAAPFTSIAHLPSTLIDWAKSGFKTPARQSLDYMAGKGPLPNGPPLGIDEPVTQAYGNALMAVAPDPGTVMGAAKGGIKGGFNAIKGAKASIPAASGSIIGGMMRGPRGAAIGAGLGALPEVSRGVFQGIKEGIPRTAPPPGSWETSGMARDIIPAGETRVPISQSTGDDWIHPSPPATMPRVPNSLRGAPIADIPPTGDVAPESTRLPYDYRGVTMPSGKVVGPTTPRMGVPPAPRTPIWEGKINVQPRGSYTPFEPISSDLPSGRSPSGIQPTQAEPPSEMEDLLRQSIENAKNRVNPLAEPRTPLMPVKVRRTI